jgi:hypothetical protein
MKKIDRRSFLGLGFWGSLGAMLKPLPVTPHVAQEPVDEDDKSAWNLYDFQTKILKALGLNGKLVTDLQITIPIADIPQVHVSMLLSRRMARKLLKMDWEKAPKEYKMTLTKLEDPLDYIDP